MRRATAASHCAAAPMKKAQLYPALAGNFMQCSMRAENFPCACEHAAVFVRIGVAKHYLLRVVPRGEQRTVIRQTPQLATYLRRVAKIFDRFEQRYWHQPRIVAGGRDFNSTQTRKP